MLDIKPIYGNGWTDGQTSICEPEPFQVDGQRSAAGVLRGQIIANHHMIDGAIFEASPRYANDDSHYNCTIRCSDGKLLQGYCQVSERPL